MLEHSYFDGPNKILEGTPNTHQFFISSLGIMENYDRWYYYRCLRPGTKWLDHLLKPHILSIMGNTMTLFSLTDSYWSGPKVHLTNL